MPETKRVQHDGVDSGRSNSASNDRGIGMERETITERKRDECSKRDIAASTCSGTVITLARSVHRPLIVPFMLTVRARVLEEAWNFSRAAISVNLRVNLRGNRECRGGRAALKTLLSSEMSARKDDTYRHTHTSTDLNIITHTHTHKHTHTQTLVQSKIASQREFPESQLTLCLGSHP